MRRAWAIGAALVVAGCSSNWKDYGIPRDCERGLAFPDGDDDGWGDPDATGEEACVPLEAGSVRNNRDCDDANAAVTGRVGSLCPDQLVAGETDFTPATIGNEFIVVRADSTVVWADAAEQACGPLGWGGKYEFGEGHAVFPRPGLATFTDTTQIASLFEVLDNDVSFGEPGMLAAWVGFHPTLRTWGHYDDAGTWVPEAAAGPSLPLCNCLDTSNPTCDDRYTEDLGYLALIRDGRPDVPGVSAADACLGTPEEALPDELDTADPEPAYETLYGHFVCERAIPDPDDWELATPEATE